MRRSCQDEKALEMLVLLRDVYLNLAYDEIEHCKERPCEGDIEILCIRSDSHE